MPSPHFLRARDLANNLAASIPSGATYPDLLNELSPVPRHELVTLLRELMELHRDENKRTRMLTKIVRYHLVEDVISKSEPNLDQKSLVRESASRCLQNKLQWSEPEIDFLARSVREAEVDALFPDSPLVSLTTRERKLLEFAYGEHISTSFRLALQECTDFISGLKEIIDYLHLKRRLDEFLLNPHIGSLAAVKQDNSYSASAQLGRYGSRDSMEYISEGEINLEAEILRLLKLGRRPVKVLDIGCCHGEALFDMKMLFGTDIVTHGVSPYDELHLPMDYRWRYGAEQFPEKFQGAFDLIVSHRTLENSIMPHLALRNIACALAPGGCAVLNWGFMSDSNIRLLEGSQEFLRYAWELAETISSEHVKRLLTKANNSELSNEDLLQFHQDVFAQQIWLRDPDFQSEKKVQAIKFFAQLAWVMEVSNLEQCDVTAIPRSFVSVGGHNLPASLRLERCL